MQTENKINSSVSISSEVEKEVREYTDKPMYIIDHPFPANHLYCVRGKLCDFAEHQQSVAVYIHSNNTKLSSECLEDKIIKLEQELEGMYSLNKEGWNKVEFYEKLYTKTKEQYKDLIESHGELLEALEPLKKLADSVFRDTNLGKEGILYQFNNSPIKYEDLRKAKSAIEKANSIISK